MPRWLILLPCLLVPVIGLAQPDMVRKESAHGVGETLNRLEQLVREKGMTVFARIDHRANAASVGMEMTEAQVLLFGNPKAGTLIMNQDPGAGLDLPLRVLVYRDADARTWLLYHDPHFLADTYNLKDTKVLDKVAGALHQMTEAAAGG